MLDLLWQYLRRTVYDGGLYEDITEGISLGCPLSPLMGALFLDTLRPSNGSQRTGLRAFHGRLGDPGTHAREVAKRQSA
ncbi:MAG: hypothetical protein ACKVHR_20020 [Pirellulales bacterium]